MEYASKSVGNAGLATGIIGTALGVLAGGTGILNGATNNTQYVTKDELNMIQTIAQKDSEIALLQSEQNTEVKLADVYEKVMTRVNSDARAQAEWNASQSVVNSQMASAIATNTNSIATLNGLVKTVVPITSVCPEPMKLYNSWTAPTTTTTTSTT